MTHPGRPLRVVHLIPMALTQHSPTSGIMAQIRHQTGHGLRSEVWSFYPAPPGRSPAAVFEALGATYRILTHRRDALDSRVLLPLVRELRRARPDVLHCHFVRANVYGRLAARAAGVPVVINTLRGIDEYLTERRMSSRVVRLVERATLPLVDRYVCVSDAVRRNAIDTLGISADRIVTVLNALDLTPFGDPEPDDRRATRRELDLPDDAVVIASIGVLRPLKNHRLAIRLLQELRGRSATPVALVIAGDGPDRESLTALVAELGLARHVRVTGLVTDVPRLLRAVDVVALLSEAEGLPRVIMEAMAAGKPCVVSDRGGMPEAVIDGRTGFVRPLDDHAGIRDALARLVEEPELRRSLGRAGKDVARTRFSPVRLASEYETLYRELLQARERGATISLGHRITEEKA